MTYTTDIQIHVKPRKNQFIPWLVAQNSQGIVGVPHLGYRHNPTAVYHFER